MIIFNKINKIKCKRRIYLKSWIFFMHRVPSDQACKEFRQFIYPLMKWRRCALFKGLDPWLSFSVEYFWRHFLLLYQLQPWHAIDLCQSNNNFWVQQWPDISRFGFLQPDLLRRCYIWSIWIKLIPASSKAILKVNWNS